MRAEAVARAEIIASRRGNRIVVIVFARADAIIDERLVLLLLMLMFLLYDLVVVVVVVVDVGLESESTVASCEEAPLRS
jgi:hypothetical protein